MTVTSTIKTYRETQFEKILCMENNNNDDDNNNNNNSNKSATSNIISNKVVKMTELRKISWNGIPVSSLFLSFFSQIISDTHRIMHASLLNQTILILLLICSVDLQRRGR